jgi:hypothetical protein
MARSSRTFAKHAHVVQKTASTVPQPETGDTRQLAKIASPARGRFLREQHAKLARYDGVVQLGLQLRNEFVDSGMDRRSPTMDTAKLAMAADTIEQLGSLVGELRSAHHQSAKVAAALAGAVKLAQDGIIDIEDVFDTARESLLDGTVKMSSIDEVFASDPGEIVEGKHAGGRTQDGMDSLTAFLRSARGR